MGIDYQNSELLEHGICAMKAFANDFCEKSLLTDVGEVEYTIYSMPGQVISKADEEGNIIKNDLAFLVEAKTSQFTIIFRVDFDSWFNNGNPPKSSDEYFNK